MTTYDKMLQVAYAVEHDLLVSGGGYDQEENFVEATELNYHELATLLLVTWRMGVGHGFVHGWQARARRTVERLRL